MLKRNLDESIDDNNRVTKQAKIMYSILSEDGTLRHGFVTSLQNIVTAKIITHLWMDQSIQMEIKNLFRSLILPEESGFSDKWLEIENNIITQVSKLFLPNHVKKKLRKFVPVLGNSLLNWIKYHDEYVLKSGQSSSYSAADFISHVKWTARGKIDYNTTAKNILSNKASALCDAHKYEIACTYCFIEEIVLLSNTVDVRYYLCNVGKLNPMVHFWTAYIRRNYNLYFPYHIDNTTSIYEHLMWLLINNDRSVKQTLNEIPIMYVWKKLNREERDKCIVPLIKQIDNKDFAFSLLSKLNYEHQQEVYMKCADFMLVGILNDWLWEEYFLPTALQILNIMDPLHYLNVLEEINREKSNISIEENKYHKLKSLFKQLWEKGPRSLKDFIYEHKSGLALARLVTNSLTSESDIDVVELILKDLTAEQKKKLIFCSQGINHCSYLIQNGSWNLLELFIKHTLSHENDVIQLKQRLSLEREIIVPYFLNDESFEKIEHFMSWCFKSEEEKDKFRRSLAYTNIYFATLESIISNDKVDFKKLEKHFKWCAKNDLEQLRKFKNGIPECPYGKGLIIKLMKQRKYQLVDQVLSWCFSKNQKQIELYKSNMYKVHNF